MALMPTGIELILIILLIAVFFTTFFGYLYLVRKIRKHFKKQQKQ